MKIYFCDVCNESIPLKDINSNRISIEDGKIICPKCAPKAARKRDTLPGGLLALFAVTFVALGAIAILGAVQIGALSERMTTLEDTLNDKKTLDSRQTTDVAGLEERLGSAEGKLAKVIGDLNIQVRELRTDLSQLRDSERANADEIKAVREKNLADLDARIERQRNDLGDDIGSLKNGLVALRTEYETNLGNTKENLGRLEELIRSGMPVVSGVPEARDGSERGSPGSVPGKADKEITDLIAQLSDPNDGVRFAATADLGNYAGERVVLALEKMIEDPADFVRKMAIRNLNKLKSLRSVPLMIQALRDEDPYVRKAAMAALRGVTSQDFGFNPEASASQRETRVKQWERWWSENRARLLKK